MPQPHLFSQSIAMPLVLFLLLLPFSARAAETPLVFDRQALATLRASEEVMHFSVSWSGGVKIGDLSLRLAPAESGGQVLTARVTDSGLFKLIYPVNDTFATYLHGPLLPRRYEVRQIERGRTVRRLTLFDQRRFEIVYRKQDGPPETWRLDGPAHNEFSAFLATRALRLLPSLTQQLPVFADKKRHLVPVRVFGSESKDSIFGKVRTLKVQPRMTFKGLYDKDGDTVFWLTDDSCRVPVEIRSKLLIGSLRAELTDYVNPACPQLRKKKAGP
uniref:DUF3108 domain-containing protein n=1 Tax=Candidatus Electronema sp. TaxID=2698783 RepID=UPI0040578FFE